MLTDTSGLLSGEEKVSVQGVTVAIQRETLRQRQIEFLQTTNNPTDQKIVGLKGRAALLRAVSQQIGLPGEEVVPPEQEIEKMQQQEQQNQGASNIMQKVEEGVQAGVKAGVQRIATELTAGDIAQQAHMPEGPPAHVGTPAEQGPQTNNPAMDLGSPEARGAVSQGSQTSSPVAGGMAPQSATLVGNSPGPGARPISPGVG
jgi:hypothetical protein